jgi:hypothetical protein
MASKDLHQVNQEMKKDERKEEIMQVFFFPLISEKWTKRELSFSLSNLKIMV